MDIPPALQRRRSLRLRNYDYAQAGAYFVTICVQHKRCLFGDILEAEMVLNAAGRMIMREWEAIPGRFPKTEIDEFIIMPNHVHGIITLPSREISLQQNLPGTGEGSLGRIVQAFKSITTHEYTSGVKCRGWKPYPGRLWQRNYWDRVVRGESELSTVREYIQNNPAKWELDKLYVATEPAQ